MFPYCPVADPEGDQGGCSTTTPPPRPQFFNIPWKWNNLVSREQIVSFSCDIHEKWDKISKVTPSFTHVRPPSRNPGSAYCQCLLASLTLNWTYCIAFIASWTFESLIYHLYKQQVTVRGASMWRRNNVVSTSMRRQHDVTSTFIQRCFDVMCLLGFALKKVFFLVITKNNVLKIQIRNRNSGSKIPLL